MKKRIALLILSVILILSTLSACSSAEKVAVNISGAEITQGIYTYFYDYVVSNASKLKIDAEDKEALKEKTVSLLKDYVAVNSLASQLGVSLSYNLKAQAASDTDSKWDLFGKYYSSIGLTKQDLNKVITNEALKDALLDYYYGENSKVKPTSIKKLKNAFTEKYVGIQVIAASLTTTDALGNTVPMDSYELSQTRNMFSSMKDKLGSGRDINEVYSNYITNLDLIGTQSLETYIMSKSSVGYGDDFFSKISALKYNTATVHEYEDMIYLAYRVDISGDDLGYFVTYKNEILKDLCLSGLDKKIASEAKKYELIKERSSVTKKVHETVSQKHSQN